MDDVVGGVVFAPCDESFDSLEVSGAVALVCGLGRAGPDV